jgi:hypothetical protein
MSGSVYVPFEEDRDVFIDNTKCGRTNIPFEVEVGTHDIDLGSPLDYDPPTQSIQVKALNSPTNPLVVHFTFLEGAL